MSQTDGSDGVGRPPDAHELARLEDPTHHTELRPTPWSIRLDGFVRQIGDGLSWIWLALLVVIVSNVTLRYAFGAGQIELEELQWHLYGVGFMFGLSYCVQNDSHIRVDFLRDRLSPRMLAWIELYGILLLALPFVALVGIYALPHFAESFASSEISPSPGGLPYRWAIKAVIPIAFALLALSFVARVLRLSSYLFAQPPDASTSTRAVH
jgi:TRAP-type mannitol/chloroaromatic compound transport system permease small subunit